MGKGRNGKISADQSLARFSDYLENRELAQNTINAYVGSMRKFFLYFPEATKENALKWKTVLMNKGLKPKSVNIRLNAFNSYCAMLGNDQNKVKTVRIHNATAVSNVISKEDYSKLLSGLLDDGNLRWYYIIRLLSATGARVSEVVRLRKDDFDRGYAELWTKGKIRRIYIPTSFRTEAAEHYMSLKPSEYLIQSRYGGQMSTRGISAMLQSLSVRYDIDKKVMHPHSFRHLFAIEFLKRNGNLSLLSDVMGHSSVSTTAIYTRMTMEQQREEINKTINW